jgi:hypothetical protein
VPPPSAAPRRGALVGALVDADVLREMRGITTEHFSRTTVLLEEPLLETSEEGTSIAGVIYH